MASNSRKVSVGVGIPLDLLNDIESIAEEKSLSKSAFIVQMIRQGMEQSCVICLERDIEEQRTEEARQKFLQTPEGKARKAIFSFMEEKPNEFTIEDLCKKNPGVAQSVLEDGLEYFLLRGAIWQPIHGTYHVT